MTTREIILWTCAYLVEFGGVIYFTRATARRIVGALIGGAFAGLLGLGAIALCEALAWWQIPFSSTPFFLPLFYVGLAISLKLRFEEVNPANDNWLKMCYWPRTQTQYGELSSQKKASGFGWPETSSDFPI
jgi:hypothetical protein